MMKTLFTLARYSPVQPATLVLTIIIGVTQVSCGGGGGGGLPSLADILGIGNNTLVLLPREGSVIIGIRDDLKEGQSLHINAMDEQGNRIVRIISNSDLTAHNLSLEVDGHNLTFTGFTYEFDGLTDGRKYIFTLERSAGNARSNVTISYILPDNEEDIEGGGITVGPNHDLDWRADSVDMDDDNDGLDDPLDRCSRGQTYWISMSSLDKDGDGCRDRDEDMDTDDDGLIEIASVTELDAMRYQLDGRGRRMTDSDDLDSRGCGNRTADTVVAECVGYELMGNLSLVDHTDGSGWPPIGHDNGRGSNFCGDAPFSAEFNGNGHTISNLTINRPDQDCVGLFGFVSIGDGTTLKPRRMIFNLYLEATEVVGRVGVGALVGQSDRGTISNVAVTSNRVSGTDAVGGIVGIFSPDSGLLGGNINSVSPTYLSASSAVSDTIESSGKDAAGGLVGSLTRSNVVSSFAIARVINGANSAGGIAGFISNAAIASSYAVVDSIRMKTRTAGNRNGAGGLIGSVSAGGVYYNYMVAANITGPAANYLGPIIGFDQAADRGDPGAVNYRNYWDNVTSKINTGDYGSRKTTEELRAPTGYEGIYDDWDSFSSDGNLVDLDSATTDPEAELLYCDANLNGVIEGRLPGSGERVPANFIWDFGEDNEYPAIRCTLLSPAQQRALYSVSSEGDIELHR